MEGITIHGCGLAGVFVGWHLWQRGISFRHVGARGVGASWAAAGLVNPVTGKGMNISWRIDEFLEEMREFYLDAGSMLGRHYFKEVPVLRVFAGEKERRKFEAKQSELEPWIGDVYSVLTDVKGGESGGVEWQGGGWVDVRGFLTDSLAFFKEEGLGAPGPEVEIFCEGTKGLQGGEFSYLPNRLAKGEILEVEIPDWKEERILNRRGWSIPIGNDRYRVGATYEWDDLTNEPTEAGRVKLEALVREFTDLPFEIRNHVAGVRPIVRNSEPVMGEHPDAPKKFLLNGLGSKGCLYGPKVAKQLVEHILDGRGIEPELSLHSFSNING
ncbi:NAD(P)/FAD-dependent oxidoreductase [Roseibacillus persicicus]|nr:FAD-dependent oxidoreductase [Roseibacillus persicicus]